MNTTEGSPNILGTRERTLYYRGPSQCFFGTGEKDIELQKAFAMVLGTGEKDIFFYFRDQANNGTCIPCEGLITDFPNSI